MHGRVGVRCGMQYGDCLPEPADMLSDRSEAETGMCRVWLLSGICVVGAVMALWMTEAVIWIHWLWCGRIGTSCGGRRVSESLTFAMGQPLRQVDRAGAQRTSPPRTAATGVVSARRALFY